MSKLQETQPLVAFIAVLLVRFILSKKALLFVIALSYKIKGY